MLLDLLEVSARRADGETIARVAGQSGRVVLIGAQPLLEAWRGAGAQRLLTFHGRPSAGYAITWSNRLST